MLTAHYYIEFLYLESWKTIFHMWIRYSNVWLSTNLLRPAWQWWSAHTVTLTEAFHQADNPLNLICRFYVQLRFDLYIVDKIFGINEANTQIILYEISSVTCTLILNSIKSLTSLMIWLNMILKISWKLHFSPWRSQIIQSLMQRTVSVRIGFKCLRPTSSTGLLWKQ